MELSRRLARLNKRELIEMLIKAYNGGLGEITISRDLNEIEQKKSSECRQLAELYRKTFHAELRRYTELIEPYAGKPVGEVPNKILKESSMHYDNAMNADKKAERYWKKADFWLGYKNGKELK